MFRLPLEKNAQSYVIAALTLGLAACGAHSELPSESDSNEDTVQQTSARLVARAEVQGFVLDYLEPEPGTLVEVERGEAHAVRRHEPADLDLVQRYEFLTNSKAPPALVEAALAAGNEGHEEDPIPQQESVDKEVVTNGGFDEFSAKYCNGTDSQFYRFIQTRDLIWRGSVEYMKGGVFGNQSVTSARFYYARSGLNETWYSVHEFGYVGFRATSTINRTASITAQRDFPTSQYSMCVNYHS